MSTSDTSVVANSSNNVDSVSEKCADGTMGSHSTVADGGGGGAEGSGENGVAMEGVEEADKE